jgi:hypothetical protein
MPEFTFNFVSAEGHFKTVYRIQDLFEIWEASSFRRLHPLYLYHMNPDCFAPFGILKRIAKDWELKSNDEMRDAIANVSP